MKKNYVPLLIATLALSVGFLSAKDLHHEERGYLGVQLEFIEHTTDTGDIGKEVRVGKVLPGSGAEAAGLQEQDRIVAINGVSVTDLEALHRSMIDARPDDSVTVTYERDGVESDTVVIAGELPHHDGRWAMVVDEKRAFLGIHLQDLTPQLAEYFDVEGGVLVSEVIDGSPAKDAGILAGDVLVEINDHPLDGQGMLHRVMGHVEAGSQVTIALQRKGQPMTLYVEAGSFKDHHGSIDIRKHRLHNIVREGNKTIEIIVPEGEMGEHLIELHEHLDHDEND